MNQPASPSPLPFGVVLLGAGASRRMGRPKLLLPWNEGTVLSHLVERWLDLGALQVLVVIPPDHADLEGALAELACPRLHRLVNPEPERGMFSSLQCAAAWDGWRPELAHWMVSLGDQPHVRESTLRRLVEEGCLHPESIVQPARLGHGRHPVWMPARWFQKLPDAASPHLKAFLIDQAPPRRLVEMEDAGLDLDLDYPEDYEAARRWVATLGEGEG